MAHFIYAQGPVAYLPLDNNLNDYSGNALHATDAGTEATTFVADAERGNVAFFATAAHAQLPLDPKLSFGTNDFSVAFWIKVDNAPTSDPSILSNKDWGSGGNAGFLIALDGADDPANKHMWTSNIADGIGGRLDWDADDNATPNLVDGTWHFVTVTYDRDATMNVYFDGDLKQTDPAQDSKDLTLVPGDISSASLPITIMQDGTGAYSKDFEAFIDEIYIYDRVLEAKEVADLKQFGLNPSQDVVLGADVYLPFDGNLNDASGNDLHATDGGTTPTGFIEDPDRGMVAHFPIDAHAQLPLDPKLNISTGDFSLAFWIKVDEAPTSDPSILSNKDWGSGGNPGFLIALDGADDPANKHMWTSNIADGVGGRLDWDADDNGTPNLVDGTWHYVAVAYDRDATMNVYFDGELKQTDPAQDSKDLTLVPGDIGAGNLPITIMQDGTGAYSKDFEAFIDEVRIWNGKVLSAEEVLQSMNAKAGVDKSYSANVYLPLDTDLNDASGNGFDATDAGTESTIFEVDPERGPVARFPLAAHAQLPLDPMLNLGTDDFSVAFWIKVENAPTSDPSILSNKDWGSGGNPGFLIALDGADDPANKHMWTSNIADGVGGRLDWDADDNGTPNLVDATWHFVAVTYDRDATMNVYFDGELKQTDPAQDSKDLTLAPGDISAGGFPITIMQDGTGAYGKDFEALLDDIRVWVGTVVSPVDILNMYKYKEAAPASDQSFGADVFLPLDENLKDQSGNGVDATNAGTEDVIFVDDMQRGLVAEFPIAAHAQFPDHSLVDFGTGDFSVSFWVKINANVPISGDPVIFGNKDWGSGGNPGFQIGLDGPDNPSAHFWTVNVSDGNDRLDWDADDNDTPNLKDGNWHFVAVAFDRDATMNVYYDGILRQSDPAQDSKDITLIPGDLNAANLPLTIMQDGTGAYDKDFEARLDDIRIWKNKVITAAEVAEIYNPVDKSYEAIIFLPLNNDLFDYSGNNLHAEDKGTEVTRFVKDPDRGDIALFPLAAHAQFPLDPKLDFGTDDFSVAFWIRINPNIDTPSDPVILGNKDWGSGGNPGFQIGLDGADDASAHLWTINVSDGGDGRLDWDADDNQTPNLKDGDWHFVVAAFDRDATLNVYFDGELRQTDPAQDSKDMTLIQGSLSSAGLPLTIMQDGTGAYSKDFAALLDNIRVWDRVVTDAEVAEMFVDDKGSGIGEGENELVLFAEDKLNVREQYFTTYPNPANNGISNISYFLNSSSNVRITVFDSMGKLVKVLKNGKSPKGNNSFQWRTDQIPTGLYIYRIETSDFNKSLRVIHNR